jgi:phosphatidylserine synthase
MSAFDLTFVLSAVIFNLLIMGIYITSRLERVKLRTLLGKITIGLGIPLSVVLVFYIIIGKPVRTLVYLAVILFYLIVELVLDFILKIEFREKPILHVPYIILFYAACFGFIAVSFSIDTSWGYAVSVTFWGVLASLIYLLRGKKKTTSAR